jgi:hypothetical protein
MASSAAGSPATFLEAWQRFEQRQRGHVVPPSERAPASRRADKDCQRRTAERRRQIAAYIEDHACALLDRGVPANVVLDHCALGSAGAQEWFRAKGTKAPSRTTLIEDFEAICGSPSGSLPVVQDFDRYDVGLAQANTYSLRYLYRTLGHFGRKVLLAIERYAKALRNGPTHTVKSFSPVLTLRRSRTALAKALNRPVGHRASLALAWHVAKLGLPERTAHDLMAEYHEATGGWTWSGRRFTAQEAHKAVESAYRKVMASASGPGKPRAVRRAKPRRLAVVNDVQWLLDNPAPGGLLDRVRRCRVAVELGH